MKLKFIDQQYQTEAVNSICDIFDGCEVKDSLFTIENNQTTWLEVANLEDDYYIGHSNKISIDDFTMLGNVQRIQEKNDIQMARDLQKRNFTIEMETGTGKTYVYIKTILELNKRYGLTKFIIVVPSVAIKEGVLSTLKATEEHFKERYDNVIYHYFEYNSKYLENVRTFATSTNVEVMVMTIAAFNKSTNIFVQENEKALSGNKPIDLIIGTSPILIIDEPQSVDSQKKSKKGEESASQKAISSLNPLCTLRYSATHKELYNLMYRLTPVDAYQRNLVKHIEVASITSNEASTKPYVRLVSVSLKKVFTCRLEIYMNNKKTGVIDKKIVTAKTREDIWELSNEVDYYKDTGFIIDNISCNPGDEYIDFSNGKRLYVGETIGDVDDSAMKRAQIHQTIEMHLNKETYLMNQGIKVLSLFFIDEVSKYRDYSREDEKGDYQRWFEEEYTKLIQLDKYKVLREKYGDYISTNPSAVHDGYFAQDGKGRVKNSSGTTNDDETTYQLIMKDKERLLSFDEPIRFIFSHSALKEGWDNPNVFQVCTLVETKDTMTKRQKIGRGLRICVNQNGERVLDPKYNTLSVIANESYKEFADTLQDELKKDNYKFGVIEPINFTGIAVKQYDGTVIELSQKQSEEIYNYLVENEYMTSKGKITNKYYQDKHDDKFVLPGQYESFTSKVMKRIDNLSREIEIKDASTKVPVKLNKEVQLSPEFVSLWNKIKQKTVYTINMDMDKFKREAVEQIQNMPRIHPDRIDVQQTKIDITHKGVEDVGHQVRELGAVYEFDTMTYPDFVRRLQDATGLLRKTIIEIVSKSSRLKEFYENPEEWIKQVSSILLSVRKENLTDGIKYEKVDKYYEQDIIFNDEGLYGYKDRNVLDVSSDKNIYDHVIYDSEVEREFALDAENDDDVLLYAKLPGKFIIETPIGEYNPDWAVVLNTFEGEKVYFVAETKGTENINDLKGSEKKKILCGRKHFEVIDTGIKYEVVKELKSLKHM